jgi:hypothetical protein
LYTKIILHWSSSFKEKFSRQLIWVRDGFVVLYVLFVICVLVVFFCFFISNRKTRSLLYTALYGRFKLQTNVVWFLNSNEIFRPSSNLFFLFFFWVFHGISSLVLRSILWISKAFTIPVVFI